MRRDCTSISCDSEHVVGLAIINDNHLKILELLGENGFNRSTESYLSVVCGNDHRNPGRRRYYC